MFSERINVLRCGLRLLTGLKIDFSKKQAFGRKLFKTSDGRQIKMALGTILSIIGVLLFWFGPRLLFSTIFSAAYPTRGPINVNLVNTVL